MKSIVAMCGAGGLTAAAQLPDFFPEQRTLKHNSGKGHKLNNDSDSVIPLTAHGHLLLIRSETMSYSLSS